MASESQSHSSADSDGGLPERVDSLTQIELDASMVDAKDGSEDSLAAPLTSGYLEALSAGGKFWKRKFFVVRDNYVQFFTSHQQLKPEGFIPLGMTSVRISTKLEHCLELTLAKKRYHIRCPTHADLVRWHDAIRVASKLTIHSKYKLCNVLGKGTFSSVKRGIHRQTKKEYAIKIISKGDIKENRDSLLTEIAILKKVRHPNVIRLFEIFETKTELYLVMEFLRGGELFDKIIDEGSFSERDASRLVRNIVSGVKYLNERGIIHRDIKPENLLYDCEDLGKAVIKIADFGLSKYLRNEQDEIMKTACGTPGYVAPEVLEMRGYDGTVDMWSVGVVLYILLSGIPPFYGSDAEMYKQIKEVDFDFPDPYWTDISPEAVDLVKGLMCRRDKRLNADEVLSHPWIVHNTHTEDLVSARRLIARSRLKKGFWAVRTAMRFKYGSPQPSPRHQDPKTAAKNILRVSVPPRGEEEEEEDLAPTPRRPAPTIQVDKSPRGEQ